MDTDRARKDFEYVTAETLKHEGHGEDMIAKWLQRAPDGSDGYVELVTNLRWISWVECASYYARKIEFVIEKQGVAALRDNLPALAGQYPNIERAAAEYSACKGFVELIEPAVKDENLSAFQMRLSDAFQRRHDNGVAINVETVVSVFAEVGSKTPVECAPDKDSIPPKNE